MSFSARAIAVSVLTLSLFAAACDIALFSQPAAAHAHASSAQPADLTWG
jgi:hypothetical protein